MKQNIFRDALLVLLFAVLTTPGCQKPSPSSSQQSPIEKNVYDAPVRLGDVMMRSLFVWPKNDKDTRDTLKTAEAFHVNRIVWIYDNPPEFNDKAHAKGIGIGTSIAHNARDAWLHRLPPGEIRKFIDLYSIRNLDGKPVIPPHLRILKNASVDQFVADQTNPEWLAYYTDYVAGIYGLNIDAIHRDDAESCTWAPRCGATFTDSSIKYFREYLRKHHTPEEWKKFGVEDIDTFNIRDHFKSLGAPSDDTLWQWTGSPLLPVFREAMVQADRDFFVAVKKGAEERTGRKLPWSLNTSGPSEPFEEAFDFRVGEYNAERNQPQTILIMSDYARQAGKIQTLTSLVQKDYDKDPNFIGNTRRHIATAYASGMIPLVPWDIYMLDPVKRFYGTVEQFGDLYHFVSAHRDLFDEHELVSAWGTDALAELYSWLPNKEICRPGKDSPAKIWINSRNVFAFVRAKPGSASKVIHLADWNPLPKPFGLAFSPQDVSGSPAAKLTFLRPGLKDLVIDHYTGETIELPEISPWGILVVEPASLKSGELIAPRIVSPLRSVVPSGAPVRFSTPSSGQIIRARFLSDGETHASAFQMVDCDKSPTITGNGWLEALTETADGGKKSGILKVRFDAYQDFSVPRESLAGSGTDLSEIFSCKQGEMKQNTSLLVDKMALKGSLITRGISTKGDATLACKVDPAWKFFSVDVGIDDAEDRRPCVRFQVWFDSKLAYESAIINPTKFVIRNDQRVVFPISLKIPEGVGTIQLRAVPGGFFPDQNTVIWANPTAR